MIAYLEGTLAYKEPTFVVMDVGGIGYHIKVSVSTSSHLTTSQKCKLQIHLQIREDAHTLYGFIDVLEKKVFLDLVSVSGVGANTAMIMLSSLTTSEIQQAIVSEDAKTIQNVKGIGKKTAERVILELKDKIKKENTDLASSDSSPVQQKIQIKNEALMALTALGISKSIAEKNIEAILKKQKADLTVEELIKYALKM